MLSDLPTSDPLDPQRVKSLDALPDSTRSHRRRLAVGLWIALVIWALLAVGTGAQPADQLGWPAADGSVLGGDVAA